MLMLLSFILRVLLFEVYKEVLGQREVIEKEINMAKAKQFIRTAGYAWLQVTGYKYYAQYGQQVEDMFCKVGYWVQYSKWSEKNSF